MKRLSRMLTLLAMAALALVLAAGSALAASSGMDWEEGVITVEGAGVAPANITNPVQARMLARRAAITDARRQLAEIVNGVNVDSETTVENMAVTSDVISTSVKAVIRGAQVVDEKEISGGYVVTMQMPVYGSTSSLASAVLPRSGLSGQSFPAPDASVAPSQTAVHVDISIGGTTTAPSTSVPATGSSAAAAPAGKAYGQYTGLIVDCRGLGLRPVMSPVIKNANGEPIYGYKNLDYDKVVAKGMAGYVTDMSRATRAGSNPLVVRAVSIDNNGGNPVLSVADANRVLIENGATHFLDQTNVVFVR